MANYSQSEIIEFIKKRIAEEQGLPITEVEIDVEFINLGLDSVSAVFILEDIEKFLEIEINPISLWDYPTIESFSKFITNHLLRPKG